MAEGRGGFEPLTFWRPAAQPRHLGGGAGFVEEHQTVGLAAHDRLTPFDPFLSPSPNVRPVPLGGDQRFF